MPFTIPEIYIGSVSSGDAYLENGQIETQINPAPLAQTPTYNPPLQPINPEGGAPVLRPQLNSKPTSYEQVCQDDMHNGVPVKECFLMPVYEDLNVAPQRTTLALGEESTPVLNQRTTKMIGEEATP